MEIKEILKNQEQISFVGRNNGFAIGMMNHINLMKVFFVTFPITLIPVVIFICSGKHLVSLFLLFPFFFLILAFGIFVFVKYDENVFLAEQKKEHYFKLLDDKILKDGKEVKLKNNIKVYIYKKFLFMETSHSYFVIKDSDYNQGDRNDFLNWIKKNNLKSCKGY